MRSLKELVKSMLATGVGWRASAALRPRGVAVLTYHRVGDGDGLFPALDTRLFAEQMRWLRARCTPISAGDLRRSALEADRRRPPVLVTFDDGYRDYRDSAYPVLKELGIPAVVFLATSFMDEGGILWTDRVHLAVLRCPRGQVRLPWGGAPRSLLDRAHREEVSRACRDHLKRIPDGERSRLMHLLFDTLGIEEADLAAPRQMLDWDEVRATMDLTSFGGHTHTHPILSRLAFDDLDKEIRTCRDRIATETGVAPVHFAYPNGRASDFSSETKAVLRRHGFDTAYTTIEGMNGPDTDWMEIKRLPGGGTIPDFVWLTSGFWRS